MPLMGYLLAALIGTSLASLVAILLFRRERARLLERMREEAREVREEEQSALMGTIASGLAHEIRNPLGTLSLNLQLLREDWENPISEREQKSVRKIDTILKEVRRLETVLNDFLRFAGRHRLRLESRNLNEIVAELLEFASPQIERARVRVRRDLATALPPVPVDANLIRQALLNLILNAVQAMPEGGDLEVRTESLDGTVRVAVKDTGVGIAPEHLAQIFNLYFSTKPSGTGLGLPMARKIAEEHEGRLEVRSTPGKGSEFLLTLPLLGRSPADSNAAGAPIS